MADETFNKYLTLMWTVLSSVISTIYLVWPYLCKNSVDYYLALFFGVFMCLAWWRTIVRWRQYIL